MGAKQKQWMDAVQERIVITTTMLSEMKSVKMLGLSPFFFTKVQNQRVAETKRMASLRWLLVWQNVVQNIPWAIVPAVTFTVYAAQAITQGKTSLQTTRAFTSLSIITLVTDPAAKLLSAIPATASSVGCFDRVQAFLIMPPRVDPREVQADSEPPNLGPSGIELQPIATQQAILVDNLTIRPDPASTTPLLNGSTFSINPGALTIITGAVGSGKTTLLKAILGELPHGHTGYISLPSRRIGYCSQSAWLPNTSIERAVRGPSENDSDNAWYQTCLYACDLDRDITSLPRGDQATTGSGSSLSGGQRLRIALARAIYSRPDIMLLDDVLSGLDNRTQAVVLARLFGPDGLLRRLRTTVVLATHSGE